MFICKICSFEGTNNYSLSAHISTVHSIKRKEYYDKYLRQEGEGICPECSKETSFRGQSYLKYCSKKCYSQSDENRLLQSKSKTGKKQSKEIIEKRIKNTDQKKKQETREKTLLEKYGDKSYNNSKQIGLSNSKPGPPKTEEWVNNIIESKRKNGTLKHKEQTKVKIGKSITELYQSYNAPVFISQKGKYNGKNHLCGYYNGIYYRSSYELKLIEYCFNNGIKIEPAEQKIFRIKYKDENGKTRFYYPDFYLPDYNIIVEVKPLSLLSNERVILKADAAMKEYDYVLITEEELKDLDSVFRYF